MPPSTAALVLLLLLAGSPVLAQAPDPDRRAILAPVRQLFDGMRKGDSAAVRAAFHPQALLATATTRQGMPSVQMDTLDAFVKAVGTPHDEVWDERVLSEKVEVDGPLASVWTEYAFYAGGKFSHCGIDAFQIAQTPDGWRIIALTDTRRREGCREDKGP
jgi:hypothetical protein